MGRTRNRADHDPGGRRRRRRPDAGQGRAEESRLANDLLFVEDGEELLDYLATGAATPTRGRARGRD